MAKAKATPEPDKRKDRHRFLALQEPRISDLEPIKGLTSLERLDLEVTRVSDLEPPIKGLTSLKHPYLKDTEVSGEQVAALKRALPNLSIRR